MAPLEREKEKEKEKEKERERERERERVFKTNHLKMTRLIVNDTQ